MNSKSGSLHDVFARLFGRDPEVFGRAPGRVNLIGEHIDYLGGRVLPMAIGLGTRVLLARAPRERGTWRLASMQFSRSARSARSAESDAVRAPAGASAGGPAGGPDALPDVLEFPLAPAPAPRPLLDASPASLASPEWSRPRWTDYPLGVLARLVPGIACDLLLDGDVPPGSGLSSSASVEVACAFALASLADTREHARRNGIALDPMALARLCRDAENQFAGVPCGIMDQAASACCRGGHALLLDCRDDARAPAIHVPIPPSVAFVVAHCGVPRTLGDSEYARRRRECEEFARHALGVDSDTPAPPLLELPEGVVERELASLALEVPAAVPSMGRAPDRARHAVEENARVRDFADALAAGDASRAGAIMNASHVSLRDLYEVSTPDLDALSDVARGLPGAHGARLTGAGFGGCVVTLVDSERAEEVAEAIRARYHRPRGLHPLAFATRADAGAEGGVLRGGIRTE